MQINISTSYVDWDFEKASIYLPVRLSTTYFDGYGECIVIVANRADGMTTDIMENKKSEVFITLMNKRLYEDVKAKVLGMDYWEPDSHYKTVDGLADGVKRKIHLDMCMF
ncbi:MAG: hypothetical protein J5663_10915 [Bacteroidaceae bacterium]|nr:hypothetical protein [Bacteroidaceae bacterium]